MNAEQLKQIEKLGALPPVLNADCMGDSSPRTLVFGYDSEATVLHVYLALKGRIECIRYTYLAEGIPVLMSSADDRVITSNAAYVPEKYALPEACDYAFCQFLKLSGEDIHFAVFDGKRASAQFHGLVLDYFREHLEQSSEKLEAAGPVAMLGLM